MRGGREASFERRDVDEGLEGRAGLTLGLHRPVELAAEEVGTTDDRLHVAGLRLDRDHRTLGGVAGLALGGTPLERLQAFPQRLLGYELHRGIQRRVDVEAALEDQVGAVLGFERLLDVVHEVLAGRAAALRRDQPEIRLGQSLGVVVLERAELHHPAEHDLAPPLRGLGALERRIVRRRPR